MADFLAKAAVFGLALAGVDDGHALAVRPLQHTGIAGLAPAERVEHGAVQHDALRRDGGDGGLAFTEVAVLAK